MWPLSRRTCWKEASAKRLETLIRSKILSTTFEMNFFQLKDLKEKNQELEKFYETEVATLRATNEKILKTKKDLESQLLAKVKFIQLWFSATCLLITH